MISVDQRGRTIPSVRGRWVVGLWRMNVGRSRSPLLLSRVMFWLLLRVQPPIVNQYLCRNSVGSMLWIKRRSVIPFRRFDV